MGLPTWRKFIPRQHFHYTDYNDVYLFGVNLGASLFELSGMFEAIRPMFYWGFDSFVGLPKVDEEGIRCHDWVEGSYNAVKDSRSSSIEECMQKVYDWVAHNTTNVKLVPGFFEDSLINVLAKDMKPAFFIDMDVDLYSSTMTALDFMFRNGLIQSGTLIAYDDWGGTEGWSEYRTGESRAHKEMLNKYGFQAELIYQLGGSQPSDLHVQTLFKVL